MSLALFGVIFGQLVFKAREGGVAGGLKVGLGSLVAGVFFSSWIIANGELGLGGKPSAVSFEMTIKQM